MNPRDSESAYIFKEPISPEEIIKIAKNIIQERFIREGPQLYSSEQTKEYLALKMSLYDREVLACIFLDQKHRIIALEELFWGTINQNTVYPREIAKRAFFHHSPAVIMVHNHPSGDTAPSRQDIALTENVKKALAFIGIHLLDHFIVGGINCISLADKGIV